MQTMRYDGDANVLRCEIRLKGCVAERIESIVRNTGKSRNRVIHELIEKALESSKDDCITGYPQKHILSHPYNGGTLFVQLCDSNRTDNDGNMFVVADRILQEDVNKHWYEYIAKLSVEHRGPYWSLVLNSEGWEHTNVGLKPSKDTTE